MDINGLEGIAVEQLADELRRGGRFVVFDYVISIVIVTFRRPSAIYYLRPGQSALSKGWQYILLSAALGWWGIPSGLIYTPIAIFKNLAGGRDVTQEVMESALGQRVREAQGFAGPALSAAAPMPAAPPYAAPAVPLSPATKPPPAAQVSASGSICPNCGAVLRPGAAVCGKCGTRVGEITTGMASTCPGCGAPADEDWRVCPRCGRKLIFECPECGEQVERRWKTCPYCEATLPEVEPEPATGGGPEETEGTRQTCPACGEPVQPDWRICPACTTPLNLKCPGCGESVEHDWKTCPFCEARL